MDQLSYEVTREKVENHYKIRGFFHTSFHRLKVARKIKNINTSFEKLYKSARDIGLKPVELLSTIHEQRRDIRQTPPIEDESLIVGRNDDVLDIVKMVCNNYQEDLPVIALLGMGGLGKTTLARSVYNNTDVGNVFQRNKMWVTISDDFYFLRILNQMVESLTANTSALETPEAVIKSLQKHLKGEKFLLVLDDVWNEKPEEWDKLRNSLLGVGTGISRSKILVTTRNQKVIDAMQTSPDLVFNVKGLSSEDSWKLFKNRAFACGGVSENDTFEAIGRSMVETCRCLPLAIKSLAGLLYSKRSEQEWELIRDSKTWESDNVLPSLRLSYDNLPYPSLKRCFAYCSILPKDSRIHRDELVKIWMALGYLTQPRGSTYEMEDVGNEYFNILLWNSLLQDGGIDAFNNIYYQMHDLVHDLALDLSKNESATVKASGKLVSTPKVKHLRMEYSGEEIQPKFEKKYFGRVETLYSGGHIPGDMLPNLKNLGVLVVNSFTKEFPRWLGMLKYVKYLDISCVKYQLDYYRLPSYIMELYNLQTLVVWELDEEVPLNFCKLINLRHLVTTAFTSRGYWPEGMERLTCLQTLPPLLVKCGRIGQLGELNNLRGTLELNGLEHVASKEEASKANLSTKSNLQFLKLCWTSGDIYLHRQMSKGEDRDEDVMEGLRPHTNLRVLEIYNFMGNKFASWTGMMKNLVKIKLKECHRCEQLPALGHLPELREIEIRGMENIRVIGTEFYGTEMTTQRGDNGSESTSGSYLRGRVAAETTVTTILFQSCTKLTLCNMWNLEEWLAPRESTDHEDRGTILVFPILEELTISNCPNLTRIPSTLSSLTTIRLSNIGGGGETIRRTLSSLTTLQLTGPVYINYAYGITHNYVYIHYEEQWEYEGTCTPKQFLQHDDLSTTFPALTHLKLKKFNGLKALPDSLGKLSLLSHLRIVDCKNLESLPMAQNLQSIQELDIYKCPILRGRCEDKSSLEWSKIQHIPHVSMGY